MSESSGPTISVVIPTYNRPTHLHKAIESVFAQTYQKFEILIVGDHCSAIEGFFGERKEDPRVRWFNMAENHGAGGAAPRNHALFEMCKTEWVAYLDDDNEWTPNHLEVFVKHIQEHPDAQFFVNSMIIDGQPLIFDDLRVGRIDTSAVCHRLSLVHKHGGWKNRIEAGYAHDYEFFSRWRNEPCVWTKEPTLLYSTEFNGQSFQQLSRM